MNINRIDIVSIPVSDQQAAKSFYQDKLGFHVIADVPMGPEQQWVQLGLEGANTSLALVTWFDQMPPGSVQGLVLDTDNIKEAHEALTTKGLTLTDIESAPWGQFSMFNDPDGNGWVLQQAAAR